MIKQLVAALLFITASSAAANADPTVDPSLGTGVAQCIRNNTEKVERAIPSLKEGAEFLVDTICAVPVGSEARVREQQHWFGRLRDMTRANCAARKPDSTPPSDSARHDPCTATDAEWMQPANTSSDPEVYAPYRAPAEALSFAAKLLLDLRLAHQNSKPQ